MQNVTITDTKAHLSALISDIEAGEEVVITRRGKPVARLIPERSDQVFGWAELEAWVNAIPARPGPTIAALREQDLL